MSSYSDSKNPQSFKKLPKVSLRRSAESHEARLFTPLFQLSPWDILLILIIGSIIFSWDEDASGSFTGGMLVWFIVASTVLWSQDKPISQVTPLTILLLLGVMGIMTLFGSFALIWGALAAWFGVRFIIIAVANRREQKQMEPNANPNIGTNPNLENR
jgi:hypothetical protein